MSVRRSVLRAFTLSLIVVTAVMKLFAVGALTKNSRIDPNDTYVTFDETTVRQAQFVPSNTESASPGTSDGQLRSSSTRESKFHVEEGYDASGQLVLDITFLGSYPSYNPVLKEARFSAGAIELFDKNGAPIRSKLIEAQLGSTIPAVPGASLIKGPVTQDILAYAKAVSATIIGDMPPAEGPASVTLRMPTRGSSGGIYTKTFARSSQGWVLAQLAFSRPIANGSISSVTSFSNVLWHQNPANDAARKTTRTSSTTLMRRASSANTPRVGRTKAQAPAPSSCTTTVTKLGGSQNVVFQHGLLGSSCSWSDSTYSMTAALNGALSFGTEIVPTITSTEALATQTSSLVSQLKTTGGSHYVLIGHSQGGLISRSAAQYFQSSSPSTVSGVITVDTPNQGAALVKNSIGAASQLGNYLNFIVDDIDSAIYCYDSFGDYGPYCTVGCSDPNGGALLCGLLLAGSGDSNIINDAIDAAGIYVLNTAVPATVDLEPGSSFLNALNSYTENFIRVGIVSDSSDIYGPFLPEQMGGDLVGGAAFGEDTVLTLQAADVALNAVIGYLILDEDNYDCVDYPDQEECVNDDAYIYAYGTIDNDIFVPDAYWDPLPLPNGCCDFSDGVVNGQSQYYPPQSTVAQYVILGADTHFASTKSAIVASALLTALERNFFVPAKGCTYTLSPTSVTEPASGGKGTFTVTTGSTCSWTVESSASWLTFTPANGTGSATVTYTISANTSGSRNGNLVVAGIAMFSVTQNGTTPEKLTVTVSGGGGTVTSSPTGIACPDTCSATFASGTTVTLTPAPALGYKFSGWSGACSGTGACAVTMTTAESVTAAFASEPTQSLTVTLSGTGTVTSSPSGISCPGTCTAAFTYGMNVTLTASAGSGYTFSGWSGACSGSGTCKVVMNAAENVTAAFVLHPTLTVTVSGSGSVTSSPSGISCPGTCSAAFTLGTTVTLTASDHGYDLSGWSGACSGRAACALVMNSPQSVTATFNPTLISTAAGNGTGGYSGDGGPAIAAELWEPNGVGVDSAGNFYIADSSNQRIRKVTLSTGIISTIAGNGTAGYSGDGGAAISAKLNWPENIAADTAGNIYIADSENNRIRKVTVSTGNISTVAGNGNPGYSGDGGAATSAELDSPLGVAVDTAGNIYIADRSNERIRKVTVSTGKISTVAGNGTPGYSGDRGLATSAELDAPGQVAIDSAGNLYIADMANYRIRKVTASTGIITTVAGDGIRGYSGDGGAATSAALNWSPNVAVDNAANFYIADQQNNRIRKVTASTGIITTVAGNGTDGYSGDGGPATSAKLASPSGVAVDATGNIYIVDFANERIRAVGP